MIDSIYGEGGGAQSERFFPERLKYDRNGIPVLSRREIEGIAVGFLQEHCPTVLESPKMTPVIEILDQLKVETGLSTRFVELGHKGRAKVVGRVSFGHKIVYLDLSLTKERKAAFRFTIAHEIGHWILHRFNYENWKIKDVDIEDTPLHEAERNLFTVQNWTAREWLEFQARAFAAALTMPHRTFVLACLQIRREIGLNSLEDKDNIARVVAYLSDRFQVSKTSVRIRVNELKLFEY